MAYGLGVAFVHVVLFSSSVGMDIDSIELRTWFAIRGDRQTPQSVSVVGVDAATFNNTKFPLGGTLPREFFARVIKHIAEAGARFIVLDLFFVSEGLDKKANEELAQALSEARTVIGRGITEINETDPSGKNTKRVEQKIPLGMFAKKADMVLPMQVQISHWGVVERISLPTEIVSSLPVNVPLILPLRKFVSASLEEPSKYDYINYYGGSSSLTRVSFYKLLDATNMPTDGYFRDRVVFIGVATDVTPGVRGEDSFVIPASDKKMYGVEIHATIAANLLDKSWIRRLSPEREIVVLQVIAIVGTMVLMSLSPVVALVVVGVLALVWGVSAYLCFSKLLVFLPGGTLFIVVLPMLFVSRVLIANRRGQVRSA